MKIIHIIIIMLVITCWLLGSFEALPASALAHGQQDKQPSCRSLIIIMMTIMLMATMMMAMMMMTMMMMTMVAMMTMKTDLMVQLGATMMILTMMANHHKGDPNDDDDTHISEGEGGYEAEL